MSTDIEEQLIAGMRQHVAGVTLTTEVLAGAVRAHRRRTVMTRGAYAAGMVGLAGVLAAVVTVGNTPDSAPSAGPPPVASAESANMRLTAAVAASEQTSYRIRIAVASKENPANRGTAEGAFDPAKRTGYLRSPIAGGSAYAEERLVDGVRFEGSTGSTTWKQEPGRYDRLNYGAVVPVVRDGNLAASADPEELFAALRRADATITQTGDSTYHFESAKSYDDQYASGRFVLVGDVTLGADGRIAKVAFESTNRGQAKPGVKGGHAYTSSHLVTVELSDYGTPVPVERPAKVIVGR